MGPFRREHAETADPSVPPHGHEPDPGASMFRLSIIRPFMLAGVSLTLVVTGSAMLSRAQTPSATALPGPQGDGSTLLANGWRLAPAGRQIAVGDLPLNLITSPDG